MFRRRFLSFPLVIGAVIWIPLVFKGRVGKSASQTPKLRNLLSHRHPIIGVVSGKAIFAQPLDEYWKKKLQEEPAAKENDLSTS